MSHRAETEAVNKLMLLAAAAVMELEAIGHKESAVTLREAVFDLSEVQKRHEDRNNICAAIESAALEYGAAVGGQHAQDLLAERAGTLAKRAVDLYQYDATIHPSKTT